MKVYKFGGASVSNAQSIRNVVRIVRQEHEPLFVVVSAMGKTTNALERVVNSAFSGGLQKAIEEVEQIRDYHYTIVRTLFPIGHTFLEHKVALLLGEVKSIVHTMCSDDLSERDNRFYDYYYDQIVSYGELISTRIISYALDREGLENVLTDMTDCLRTDNTWREAKVDMAVSDTLLHRVIDQHPARIYVAQGFIGGTAEGLHTTLGREGSDYTAAIVANLLNADSVTIWKDVPGILNADPRLVKDTVLLPELTYYDAVELAYSGAQVIHPKTIRPLENKSIPLYVRPFTEPDKVGSVIKKDTQHPIDVPVYIWRREQVLLTIRPNDFSFILEDSLNHLFDVVYRHHLKVSLIQSSAVTVSVCVDACRYLHDAIEELSQSYRVTYNEHLSLLTIRGTTPEILSDCRHRYTILLSQTTRRTARFVVKGAFED
ncbi:MAG TPA: aspartate kinase [Bacteroidales bacterium]|nr:aspartate kinase [Bacteroidales bacterium]